MRNTQDYFNVLRKVQKNWKFLRKPSKKFYQRQLYPKNYYYIDENFYLVKTEFLKKYKAVIKENLTNIFYVNREYPLDINTHLDFKVASDIMSV